MWPLWTCPGPPGRLALLDHNKPNKPVLVATTLMLHKAAELAFGKEEARVLHLSHHTWVQPSIYRKLQHQAFKIRNWSC